MYWQNHEQLIQDPIETNDINTNQFPISKYKKYEVKQKIYHQIQQDFLILYKCNSHMVQIT